MRDGGSYDAYVAMTSTAVAGIQARVEAVVTWPGSVQVSELDCGFTRPGIKVDAALLRAAKSCLNVVIPTADQSAASAWVNTNAAGLPLGTIAKKTANLHGLILTVACYRDTVEVSVNSRQSS